VLEGNGDASDVGAELITHFENLIVDSERITNPLTRTLVLVALGEVNYQIQRLLERIDITERMAAMPGARQTAVARFTQRRKTWRCRNSQTGRFEKMEFCKKHPDVSQVETR
jgi:hypothetical protein